MSTTKRNCLVLSVSNGSVAKKAGAHGRHARNSGEVCKGAFPAAAQPPTGEAEALVIALQTVRYRQVPSRCPRRPLCLRQYLRADG